MPLLVNISGTFAILATAWSKTSFAITLLRISTGWIRALVWCIIASMNMLLGLSALFNWIQCTPFEKSWNPTVEGTCYPMGKLIDYLMISAGMSLLLLCSNFINACELADLRTLKGILLPWTLFSRFSRGNSSGP